MTPATRRFYARYHLLATILPAYLQGVLLAGLLFWQAGQAGGGVASWALAGAWGVCCVAGVELLSRLGFVLAGTPARRIVPDPADAAKLTEVLAPPPGGAIALNPALVEIGEVPLLAAGGYTPDQLWISTHTLRATSCTDLRLLLAHERAHVMSRDLLRFVLAAAFWGISWPVAQIARGDLWWLLAWAFLQGALWLHMRQLLEARQERNADCHAAARTDPAEYGRALARYLAQFELPGSVVLRTARLRGLGMDAAAIKHLLAEQATLQPVND
jgi:hypothetical protein